MLDMNYIYRGFYFIGATTTAFFLFKVACKIFNAIKVYGFKSYPNFSNYGRWSGKLIIRCGFQATTKIDKVDF